jgi:hypothetical protein
MTRKMLIAALGERIEKPLNGNTLRAAQTMVIAHELARRGGGPGLPPV